MLIGLRSLMVDGRRTRIRSFPIGIDVAGFKDAAEKAASDRTVRETIAGLRTRKLIIGVDRILNELRCITNAIGNMVATLVIARWEGKIDLAHARAVLDGRIQPDLDSLDEPDEAMAEAPAPTGPSPARHRAMPAAIPAT